MKRFLLLTVMILSLLPAFELNSKLYDSIFIIINEDVITFNEYKLRYLKLKSDLLRRGIPMPRDSKLKIFDVLVNEKIIRQTAQKNKIFVSDTEVDESINRLKTMNRLSDAAFKQALAQEGKRLQDLEEEYRQQLLSEKIMSIELRPRISQPEEDEIKDYYNKNKSKMIEPPKIEVSHILIKDNPNASLSERSRIKKNAQEILKKTLNSKNFEQMARTYSEDETSKALGGNIGYVAKGEWLPEIDNVLFSLKTGQVASTLLQSRWGYHIVKVTAKKRKRTVPYEDMRSRILNFLMNQKMKDEYDKWISEKKGESYFEVIFPEDEKYVYDYNKWKKKNSTKFLSDDIFEKKINSIII